MREQRPIMVWWTTAGLHNSWTRLFWRQSWMLTRCCQADQFASKLEARSAWRAFSYTCNRDGGAVPACRAGNLQSWSLSALSPVGRLLHQWGRRWHTVCKAQCCMFRLKLYHT